MAIQLRSRSSQFVGVPSFNASDERVARLYNRRTAASRPFVASLSIADIAQFRRDGWVAIEGVFSQTEVDDAKYALSDLVNGRSHVVDRRLLVQDAPLPALPHGALPAGFLSGRENRAATVGNCVRNDGRLAAMAEHPRLLRMVSQLIGVGGWMIQDAAIMKPAYIGAEEPWRQDASQFDWHPLDGILSAWIALDPATVENGCVHVIPGSHVSGPEDHATGIVSHIPDERVLAGRAVCVPLKPGGVLLFSGLLHHGAPPNRSGQRRRAIQLHFAAAHCRRMTYQEHASYFSEGGKYAGCRQWDGEEP